MSGLFNFSRRRFLQHVGGISALSLAASRDTFRLANASAQPGTYNALADNTPIWSINPYAIAELITGQDLRQVKDWANVRKVLQDAFRAPPEAIFVGNGGTFEQFQQIARSPNAKIDRMEIVKKLIKIYGEESMGRVLPYLVSDVDAFFSTPPPGAPGNPDLALLRPVADSWRKVQISEYAIDDVSYLDPQQGVASDCSLISSMIALAWSRPTEWRKWVKQTTDSGAASELYTYTFCHGKDDDFTHKGVKDTEAVAVSPSLRLNKLNRFAYAESSTNPHEGWPGMIEKAFVVRRSRALSANPIASGKEPTISDYNYYISNEDTRVPPHVACQALVGGVKHEWNINGAPPFPNVPINSDHVTTQPTVAWTHNSYLRMHGANPNNAGVQSGHAYAVLGFMIENGQKYVVLRNPHGYNNPVGEAHATGPFKSHRGPSGAEEIKLDPNMGMFALREDWACKAFMCVGWVDQW